jgi:hypothetical protein
MRFFFIGLISLVSAVSIAATSPVPSESTSPSLNRIGGRMAAGQLTNQGTVAGSTSFAAPDAFALRFATPNVAVGFGSDLVLSSTLDRVHLWGLRSLIRYYFIGSGVPLQSTSDFATFTERSKIPVYVGMDLRRYTYYFDNPGVEDFDSEGTFFNTNGQIGLDWMMSRTVSLNVEFSMTLLTFAAAQEIFRIGTTSVLVGLGFDF